MTLNRVGHVRKCNRLVEAVWISLALGKHALWLSEEAVNGDLVDGLSDNKYDASFPVLVFQFGPFLSPSPECCTSKTDNGRRGSFFLRGLDAAVYHLYSLLIRIVGPWDLSGECLFHALMPEDDNIDGHFAGVAIVLDEFRRLLTTGFLNFSLGLSKSVPVTRDTCDN